MGRKSRPMPREPYTLVTERLRLCPVCTDDAPALLALFRTAFVRRYLLDDALVELDWVLTTLGESEAMFDRQRFGLWSAFLAAGSDLIGFCGFIAESDEPRLICGLSEALSGMGFAREAALAVVAFASDQGLDPIRASVDAANVASRALRDALGFEIIQTSDGHSGAALLYEKR